MAAIRFRVRSLLLLVPAVAVSIVVYIRWVDARQVLDLTGNSVTTCEVHSLSMSPKLVDLTYGMRYDTPMDEARPALFPHANEPYDTRACMGVQQTKARVYVCPLCTKAHSAWLQANNAS